MLLTTSKGKVDVIQKGKGKDILLLHGFLSSKETFVHQISFLSNFYKVTAIDILGFGKSDKISYPYSVDDYVDLVVEVMDKIKINKSSVIAHSFGGRIAVKLASKTDRVDKLLLTGCAGVRLKKSLKVYFKIYSYKLLKKFISREKLLKKFASSDYQNLNEIERQSFKLVESEDLRECMRKIQAETLILSGEKDKATPPKSQRIINNCIFGSELILMKNAGHFAFIDKPYEFNLIAKEFFS